MADDEQSDHTEANLAVRNAILAAIKTSIAAERAVNLSSIGGLAGAVNDLATTDLYSKGPPDNNYSKNTKRTAFDPRELVLGVDAVRKVLKE